MKREQTAPEHVARPRRLGTAGATDEAWAISLGSPDFPSQLAANPQAAEWRELYGFGRPDILHQKCLGLICSVQCPGSVVIKTFDAIRELRDAAIVVAGGFHSPMEKECLEFLLRGDQPVVVCPAKGLGRARVPPSWRPAFDAGRMLIITPFGDSVRRTTSAQAQARNEFVAALASVVLIPHASPVGKAEAVARSAVSRGQPLFTFCDDENKNLLQLGVRPYNVDEIKSLLTPAPAAEHYCPTTATH